MEYFLIITLGDTGNGFKGIECSWPLEIKKKNPDQFIAGMSLMSYFQAELGYIR